MERLEISVGQAAYPICIGENIIENVVEDLNLSRYSKIAIIRDENLKKPLSPRLTDILPGMTIVEIEIKSGENNKNIQSVENIWQELLRTGFDRKSLLINYGGGLTCDLGGFAAATYMRGINFLHIPTTLLSDVDASIGGKVGVNFLDVKNIIGSFVQPQAVIIDIAELQTLAKREFFSGFAEMIKHALIRDKDHFIELTDGDYNKSLSVWIKRSCQIKSEVVTADERESGLRKILNFGHTFGHAVETASYQQDGCALLHGEAVAIGIVFAAILSVKSGRLLESELTSIVDALKQYNLPVAIPFQTSSDNLWEIMSSDKKSVAGKLRWTLLNCIGEAEYDVELEDAFVKKLIDEFITARGCSNG